MTSSAASTPKSYHTDPTLYLYTSLTAGSSHIITATSRLETILKANKIPFQALDVATDEKARMLWGRRAGGKKLPGLVRMGLILADLPEVEEWNEYGEVKDNLIFSGPQAASTPTPSASNTPSKTPSAPAASTPLKSSTTSTDTPFRYTTTTTTNSSDSPSKPPSSTPSAETPITLAMRQAGIEAAKKAGDAKIKARTGALDSLKVKDGDLQKLDNSGPTGLPPPSGTTQASDAINGSRGSANVESKAGFISATDDPEVLEGKGQAEETAIPTSKEAEAAANESILEDKSHVVLVGQGQTPVEGSPRSETFEGRDEALKRVDSAGSGLKQAISATDMGEEVGGGKRTQEQGAAEGGEVGKSVGD